MAQPQAALTPGITRRDEPLICGRLAHESRAVRGRVHAVVGRGVRASHTSARICSGLLI
jgi:hypothetical protein